MSTCENLAINGKTPSIRKKYSDRKGPPYAAPDCKKQFKQGNDGLWYQSQKNAGGVWTWKKTPDYVSDIVPDVVESAKYNYSMTILPRLLNCAYTDSDWYELDWGDRNMILDWYTTRIQEVAGIYSDIVDSPVDVTTNQLGIVIYFSGPEDKKEIMLEMIPEMFSDPDDDGNYPLNFYYPGASDDIDCLVSSEILEQGFTKSVDPPKKKSIAEIRKECKEKGLVYDTQLKDCRPSKRVQKVVEPVVVEPVVVEPVVVEPVVVESSKKKSIAEIRKECQEKGLVYDAQLKDCRPSKRVAAASPEVKKLYRDTMELINKLSVNIEKASKSANALEELGEYNTLLSAML